ncbi:hypothetical protein [Bizionia gelidisalsuginis]|uniref:hypothetical protein n=1 Tax=Bizionia gelidisalsuginis TaxID=291188 RepID=UPI001FEA6F8D|nr:hypothetical protein [Bizionia gelidisalsuginis]
MKIGSVNNPENIDFILPRGHSDTAKTLASTRNNIALKVHVSRPKLSKADLK